MEATSVPYVHMDKTKVATITETTRPSLADPLVEHGAAFADRVDV